MRVPATWMAAAAAATASWSWSSCCWARVVHVNWDIGYVSVNRDGYATRRAIGANGALPIPALHVSAGDTIALHVRNSLDEPTAVHFHGLFQNGTAYGDGAGMTTQCGIPPGGTHTYVAATGRQTGTYWVHGHFHDQNADGLRAPLVIHEAVPPADYDAEYLFSLEDWYDQPFADRMRVVLDPRGKFPPDPAFPYGLVNGYNGNKTQPIRFEPGRRYRIRVVNMSLTEWFRFSLPGHRLRVIEADGVRAQPCDVDALDLGPAQRYSAVVQAHDSVAFNYIYNATLYANFVPRVAGMNPRVYLGSVEYAPGAPTHIPPPPASDAALQLPDDSAMQALDGEPLLEPVDARISLLATSHKYADGTTRALFDGLAPFNMSVPAVPALFTAASVGELALDPAVYGPQACAHVLRHLDVVEIEISNPTDIDHPFHMHGHTFQIVEYGPASAGAGKNATAASKIPLRRTSRVPMRRDTLVVRTGEYVRIRFRADNPGVWMFHCHMDVHFALGLAITLVEAPDVLQQRMVIPPELINMCLAQDGLHASGNAAGNAGLDMSGILPPPAW
ncbi:ferroxidase fet3 [Coemansia sp. RSA 1200]|nr:ferroxidase fet3 [Coemansia sp. RSA 1200]